MIDVLVVDDEADIRKALTQTLEIEGINTLTAANGQPGSSESVTARVAGHCTDGY